MTIWRMRIACWITKATSTHSEYVILTAFPLQQWLQECTSMLRNTYIACLVLDLKLVTQNCAPKKNRKFRNSVRDLKCINNNLEILTKFMCFIFGVIIADRDAVVDIIVI